MHSVVVAAGSRTGALLRRYVGHCNTILKSLTRGSKSDSNIPRILKASQ